jgi:MYXO-CTERM domain-containing protein
MRLRTILPVATVFGGLLLARPASAHFHLDGPVDWLATDAQGDPQKAGPCGSTTGAKSNKITKVAPGSKLKILWTETIPHPGHYRISLNKDRTKFVDAVPVVEGNDCKSAPIGEPNAVILADGVEVHGDVPTGTKFEHEITLPAEPCDDCTIQIVQFMSDHAPPCFYYHCANIKIDATHTGAPVEVQTGPPPTTSGNPATSGGTSGASTSGGDDEGTSSGGNSSSGGRRIASPSNESSGCSTTGDASLAPVGLAMIAGLAFLRRRKKH